MSTLKVRLDRAQQAFEGGKADRAARIIHQVRSDAIKRQDGDELGVIDGLAAGMRAHLDGDELATFDSVVVFGNKSGRPSRFKKVPASAEGGDDEIGTSQLGFWLAIAGVAAMTVAVFLPEASTTTLQNIENNTLIQSGDGWAFLVLGIGSLAALYRAYRGQTRTWWPLIAGLLAIGLAIVEGQPSNLKYCSTVLTTACTTASPGIGLYLAGVGGGLLALGGVYLHAAAPTPSSGAQTRVEVASAREMKRCPDCAEDVMAEARICKHCGFRFA